MIGYATLGVSDLESARAFYDALLAPMGAGRLMTFGDELGGFTMWGVDFGGGNVAITRPFDGNAPHRGNGNMLALNVASRAAVANMHAHALALGGTCEGEPGVRGDEGEQAFFGAYFRDPDGNKLCAFAMGPGE